MEITTDRLLLREFTADDWQNILVYQSDPEYLRYYTWTERTPEAVQRFINMFIEWRQAEPRIKFQFAITVKGDPTAIGIVGIRKDSHDSHEAAIGYELAREQWGKGYATEVARAMLDFGFTELKLHRIAADCVPENTGSAHVLEKIGMTLEGHLRDKEYYKGRYWDNLLYAILGEEWRG